MYVGNAYGDIERGIYLVRGENVVLLGEMDAVKESEAGLEKLAVEDILEKNREQILAEQEKEKLRNKLLLDRGIQLDMVFEDGNQ